MATFAGDLIITNGDAAGELLRHALRSTEVLPWRDVLHEGPIPATDTLDALTTIRAGYLASRGWGEVSELTDSLKARDRGLAHSAAFGRVALWFEHDLYDQLQLLQILDWFNHHRLDQGSLLLVQAADFLGRQTADNLAALKSLESPVTDEQLVLASEAWQAFRAPRPEPWHDLLDRDLTPLPFLRPAVTRMLEELPGPNGLTRTEQAMLAALANAPLTPPALFVVVQRQEEAVFMGDWSFWGLLDGLALAQTPLVAGLDGAPFKPGDSRAVQAYFRSEVSLTPFGHDVLAGPADHAAENGIDRWWGGTLLTRGALWRWDPEQERLIASA